MGKLKDRRKEKKKKKAAKKEAKRARKFGVNPITKVALGRKQSRRAKKNGFNKDTGFALSKRESKKLYGNRSTRDERTKKRAKVQTKRAEEGQTFAAGLGGIVNNLTKKEAPAPAIEQVAPAPAPAAPAYIEPIRPEYDEIPAENARRAVQSPSPLMPKQNMAEQPESKKGLYIGLVVAVFLVVGIFFIIKKKK